MVCLGFEPGAAGWKARTNPLSYSGTPYFRVILALPICSICYGRMAVVNVHTLNKNIFIFNSR